MKKLLFTPVLLVVFTGSFSAQTSPDIEAKLKLLMEKNAEYHRKTDGEYDGYRIKIHFGIDKTRAHEVKAKFLSKYPDSSAYEEYQQPNFVVVVGDYKTRPEAFELFKKIQGDFPNAFIIKDKIRPVKL